MLSKTYQCPWCPCFFFNQADLDSHLAAAKITGVPPNEYDHKVWWKNQLASREKEF